MTEPGLVDWTLARRIAVGLAGDGGDSGPFEQRTLDSACADAVTLVDRVRGHAPGRATAGPGADRSRRVGASGSSQSPRASGGWSGPSRTASAAGGAGRGRKVAGGRARPPPRPASPSAMPRARSSVSTTSPSRVPIGQPGLVFVGPNLASAHAELGRTPVSSCAGSRSTRPPTRCSSAQCRGSGLTWWHCSTGCSRAPRAGSTTRR